MKLLILSVCNTFSYKLYSEYVAGISEFLKINKNKENDIIFYNTDIENNYEIDKYDIIIYFGDIPYFKKNIVDKFEKIYYVNIEPLTYGLNVKNLHNLDKNTHILDYSEENCLLHNNFNHFSKINLLFPYFKNIDIDKKDKTIDVTAISNNKYRDSIINEIKKSIECKTLLNCFNNVRDEIFKKSKIYINIHGMPSKTIMESIRINNLIMNKVIIISQPTINNELLYFKDYIIICNDNNEIISKVKEILKNYDYFYDKIYGNFCYNKYVKYIEKNIEYI